MRISQTAGTLTRDVAGEVRAWIARQQRTGRSVALELGWTEIYMSRRLTGKVPFDVADLEAIADVLEVPVTVFFELPAGVRKRGINPPTRSSLLSSRLALAA